MRLLQISVSEDQREPIIELLRERQLGYTVLPTAERDEHYLVQIVVPADAVEHILAELGEIGFDRHEFTVSLDAQFASFEDVDAGQNRWGATPNKIAPETLRSKAKDLRRNTRSYVWMMILSAVVATAGLLLSSPAVVVGSMVIAPIVSPTMTASVGIVRNDRDMFIKSIHIQALGLGVAIVSATVFGFLIKSVHIVPSRLAIEQMDLLSLRIAPSILSIFVGVAAGAAGAFGLATKGQVTIVGVMIAAALIPTAAVVGIGLAWGNLLVAVGALLLLTLTIINVNIGGTAMLFYLGYRPDEIDESLLALHTAKRTVVVGGTILLVVVSMALVGIGFYQQSLLERTVNDATADVLTQNEYRALGIMKITVEYTAPEPFTNEPLVTVTLSRTSNQPFTELPTVLAERINERTERNVIVQIRYVDFERSRSSVTSSAVSNQRSDPGGAE